MSDLAPGPAGEAIALWRASHGSAFDATHAELWAARTFIARHDRPGSAPPELLAATGPKLAASVAVDPANDHAVAAWLAGRGARGGIEYASAPGASGYRPHPPSATLPRTHGGTHWLRITLAALAAAVCLAAGAALALRRHRQAVS